MYKVILIAEDGEYTLTEKMTEEECISWIRDNEKYYGEGQELFYE